MEKKISAKDRFIDRNFDVKEDWDGFVAEQNPSPSAEKILKLQEDYGNATNSGLGRETWYSNEFFINSLVLKFLSDAEDKDNELFEELKKVYIGYMGKPGMTAEAMNMDESSDGYLITMNFDIDLQLQLMCKLTSSYLYSIHSNIKKEEVVDQYMDVFAHPLEKGE